MHAPTVHEVAKVTVNQVANLYVPAQDELLLLRKSLQS